MAYNLEVKVVRETYIDELLSTAPQFNFLKGRSLVESDSTRWNMNGSKAFCLQAMFIGKTGYGKSSTLNRICGKYLFPTSDTESCTKKLYSGEFKMNSSKNHYFTLCDLPGIGESDKADEGYQTWYKQMLYYSSCVVYLLRADQRDFSRDEIVINSLLRDNGKISPKLLVGLNYADKIEPVTRVSPFAPNSAQKANLESKVSATSKALNIPSDRIIYYSATEGYNFNLLLEKISGIVKNSDALR